jgi:hypothetical protein
MQVDATGPDMIQVPDSWAAPSGIAAVIANTAAMSIRIFIIFLRRLDSPVFACCWYDGLKQDASTTAMRQAAA